DVHRRGGLQLRGAARVRDVSDHGEPGRDGLAPGSQLDVRARVDQGHPDRGHGDRTAHVQQQPGPLLQRPKPRGGVPLADPGLGAVAADGQRRSLRVVAVAPAGRAEGRHAGRGQHLNRHGARRGRRRGGGLGRAGLSRSTLRRAALDGRGAGRRVGGATRRGGTRAGRGGGPGPAHAGDELVGGEAEDRQDQHGQYGGPAHPPALPLPKGHGGLEHLGGRDFLGRSPGRIELVDQRHGILPHGPRDGADVAARIEITAARSVVILLYTPDDGLRDTSALTDVTNGEPGPATGGGQRRANAHARLLAPGSDPVRGAYPYRRGGKHRYLGGKRRPFGTKLRAPAAQGGTLGAGLTGEVLGESREPGPQRGADGTLRRAEDADGEQSGVAGAADRDGRDRDAGRHLDDREQRV